MTKDKDLSIRNYSKLYDIKSCIILSVCVIASIVVTFLIQDILIVSIITLCILLIGLILLRKFSKYDKQKIKDIPDEMLEEQQLRDRLENLLENAENVTQSGFGKQIPVDSNDEIGKLAATFNYLLDNVGNFVKELDEISEESSDTSRNLADITHRTSCVMQEVSTTLQELTSNTSNLSGSIEEIAEGAYKVEELTNEGITSLRNLEHKMENIVENANSATLSIKELNSASKKMQGIIDVISNIAKQTNLLALNAAIEAARAGDTGKGFAVVADEVRELAGNTQDSLKSISELISTFSKETIKTVDIIDSNNKDIIQGGQILKETSETFNVIAQNITNMVDGIKNSADASSQIANGSKEIASATGVQTNAIADIADLSQKLSNMASELKTTLSDTQIGGANLDFDLVANDNSIKIISENDKKDLKGSLGIDNKYIIGIIARLEPVKGYDFLIDGLKKVLPNHNDVVCIIVGDGSLENKLKEKVKKEQLSDRILFLGYRKDILKLLAIMDLVVLTSEKEGMPPRTLMEAMASSKPIVATNVKGNSMLVKDNKTGLLVNYNDVDNLTRCLEFFVKNPSIGMQYGNKGREHLEKLINN
ncbi:methyl-accepting chemotaxis protein [Vallitalea sp.]|uniref:methyl-accepting chemotaxis protein n=1 Tax=Vallitalea sp. TaxID=1882829 RepID=UPI0025E10FA7|nr:methyl-accepting chemotaxis protein [Vallitalea sp.]MCT4686628.1 methyl-accepting chemotaxis protein [Vallitalea sp.]